MTASTQRNQELLLEFLRENDAACPVCGYNIRALTRPVCPECRQELSLSVGATRVRFGLLLAALVPGFFCGIAACFVAIPTVAVYFEDGIVVWPFAGAVIFGWCSGMFAIALAFGKWKGRRVRNRFIALPVRSQRSIVLIIWLVHIAVGLVFFGWLASEI